tara:strand:+ start:10703 stop:11431 length:729 start_codon:yes stop_codon:yes gene_type:complete
VDLKKYFSEAQDEANENFFNADGFADDYDFADEDYSFDGGYDDGFDMATGGSAPTSQPYIISVKNTNTTTAYPVTILGANVTLANTSPNWQNSASISITMGISGITYNQFLYQTQTKPFFVGQTYYQSSTANQVLETLTLISSDASGNTSQKTLVPTIDPYQQQSTIIVIKYNYIIDGNTSIVIASVLASATVKIYLYPAETVSTARTLTGRRAVRNYGNPNIVRSDSLKLSASTLRALKGE